MGYKCSQRHTTDQQIQNNPYMISMISKKDIFIPSQWSFEVVRTEIPGQGTS
jgi:hypothetical protein